jgi:hypothetical protein
MNLDEGETMDALVVDDCAAPAIAGIGMVKRTTATIRRTPDQRPGQHRVLSLRHHHHKHQRPDISADVSGGLPVRSCGRPSSGPRPKGSAPYAQDLCLCL